MAYRARCTSGDELGEGLWNASLDRVVGLNLWFSKRRTKGGKTLGS